MKRQVVFFGMVMLGLCANAQWQDIPLDEFSGVILGLEGKIPEGSSYAYRAKYLFFEEPNSTDTTLAYDFELCYQAQRSHFYMSQFGREVIQHADIQMICDTAVKQLVLLRPEEKYLHRKTTEDFALLLNSKCKAQKRMSGKNTVYYLTFADGARYHGAEMWLTNEGLVSKYILYTATDVVDDSHETDRIIHPRMEIHFTDYKFGKQAEELHPKGIPSFFSDLKTKTPAAKYKDFEIIDLRTEIK